MNTHVAHVRSFLREHGIDAFLIKSKTMKKYLGTLTGSGCNVLITASPRECGYLIMDGRYVNEAAEREHDLEFRVHAQGESYLGALEAALAECGCSSVAVESDAVRVPEFRALEALGLSIELLGSEVARMRMVKDDEEVAAVQRAVDLADDVYAKVLERLRVGMTEYEIGALVQYFTLAAGAETMSFDTIVCTGPRTAMPHGRPTSRTVRAHEPVLIDFGAQLDGYQSDMTRVCFLGEPTGQMRELYDVVLEAHLAGVRAIRSGAIARDVDAAARAIIEDAGYGEYFTHGLGHGIGLGGDYPLLNRSGDVVLGENMIMSCEPGVYLPGVGGVRIEDDVVVRDGVGCSMNRTSKSLTVMDAG